MFKLCLRDKFFLIKEKIFEDKNGLLRKLIKLIKLFN